MNGKCQAGVVNESADQQNSTAGSPPKKQKTAPTPTNTPHTEPPSEEGHFRTGAPATNKKQR